MRFLKVSLLAALMLMPGFLAAGPGPALGPRDRIAALRAGQAQPVACCKVCKAGKACGDSCISRDKACHKAPGCACDG